MNRGLACQVRITLAPVPRAQPDLLSRHSPL